MEIGFGQGVDEGLVLGRPGTGGDGHGLAPGLRAESGRPVVRNPDLNRPLALPAQPLPVFASGGIDVERVGELGGLGITRVAVAGAITSAADPAVAAGAILAALRR